MADDVLIDLPPEPVVPTAGLGAKHLVDMLRRHYQPEGRPPAGVFAPEIGSPDGRRRADLIWLPTTVAGGSGLHGHEIKVTRADLLTELADPTKADPWAQYCSRWWLVLAHPSLAAGLDIPTNWGVMAPPSGRRTRTMTVVKPAPELVPKEPAHALAKLAAWQLYNAHDATADLRQKLATAERQRGYDREELARLRAAGAGVTTREAAKIAAILEQVRLRTDVEHLWGVVPDDTIVDAILDHQAATEAAKAIRMRMRGLIANVQAIVEPFGYALDELRKAERLAAQPDPAIADAAATVLAQFPGAEVS